MRCLGEREISGTPDRQILCKYYVSYKVDCVYYSRSSLQWLRGLTLKGNNVTESISQADVPPNKREWKYNLATETKSHRFSLLDI